MGDFEFHVKTIRLTNRDHHCSSIRNSSGNSLRRGLSSFRGDPFEEPFHTSLPSHCDPLTPAFVNEPASELANDLELAEFNP